MRHDINQILAEFNHLPKFPDGRINYSNSQKAPVLVCIIKNSNNEILLLKRSEKVSNFKGFWSNVAGFIDSRDNLKDKILEELREELGLLEKDVKSITFVDSEESIDNINNKIWIRYPAIVNVDSAVKITLDWEHTEYKWVLLDELKNYKTAPGFLELVNKILSYKE